MAKAKNLKDIIENAHRIAGFGAVVKYGSKLTVREINILADYASAFGGNREHVVSVLKNSGRPLDVSDPTYRSRCLLCRQLNNYCCC